MGRPRPLRAAPRGGTRKRAASTPRRRLYTDEEIADLIQRGAAASLRENLIPRPPLYPTTDFGMTALRQEMERTLQACRDELGNMRAHGHEGSKDPPSLNTPSQRPYPPHRPRQGRPFQQPRADPYRANVAPPGRQVRHPQRSNADRPRPTPPGTNGATGGLLALPAPPAPAAPAPVARAAAPPPEGVTCWTCRQRGHLSRQCPTKTNSPYGAPPYVCYACGVPGHSRKECPTNPPHVAPSYVAPSYVCFGCGIPGHLKSDCPALNCQR